MKIIRNEKEYELTAAEMREAYVELKRKYFKEDIETKAKEMEIDVSKCIYNIVDGAERALDCNDSYWEAYWMSIEYAIEEYATMEE